MAGGEYFTKLDLSHAYLQLQVEESSRPYLTINTHKGLYQYTRLPFGVASAPSIFQRTMENLLQGLPYVSIYLDDILISGRTEEEHLANVEIVLEKLCTAGMRLRKDKCQFMLKEVEYLGHNISGRGIQPTAKKVSSITNAPRPTNVTQLKAFLGLINYYGKFLSNLAVVLNPLYALLHKNSAWRWGKSQEEAFLQAKDVLKSPQLLVHYNCTMPLVLACDASPYGVGAVLSHVMPDGERPNAYSSRCLNVSERNYAQIDKEALAIVYGVNKFHKYLLGRKFTIYTDHKPLMFLFRENKGIPKTASARVTRWALQLSGYQYSVVHRPGKDLANADGLSRLPTPITTKVSPPPPELVHLLDHMDLTPITARDIRFETSRDVTLSRVKQLVMHGWHSEVEVSEQIAPFERRKSELSVLEGCVMWGSRVIIPEKYRVRVLRELHHCHIGTSRMKSLARGYVWWPGMDTQIEQLVKSCGICQKNRNMPTSAPLHPWEYTSKPWSRLHIDHLGPFQGKLVLVVVDSYSKWIEAVVVKSTSTAETLTKLRQIFSVFGLPDRIVSDNATCFSSEEFQTFVNRNGIIHTCVSPYHPSSNGLAERAVQTVKCGMCTQVQGTFETKLSRVLFSYRNTPHSVTGYSPAEMLFGRKLNTHLSKLHPDLTSKLEQYQEQQKVSKDSQRWLREFEQQDCVWVHDFRGSEKWVPGVIDRRVGPLTYIIRLDDGRYWKRHIDHLKRNVSLEATSTSPEGERDWGYSLVGMSSRPIDTGSGTRSLVRPHPPVQPRRSTRQRNEPDWYHTKY